MVGFRTWIIVGCAFLSSASCALAADSDQWAVAQFENAGDRAPLLEWIERDDARLNLTEEGIWITAGADNAIIELAPASFRLGVEDCEVTWRVEANLTGVPPRSESGAKLSGGISFALSGNHPDNRVTYFTNANTGRPSLQANRAPWKGTSGSFGVKARRRFGTVSWLADLNDDGIFETTLAKHSGNYKGVEFDRKSAAMDRFLNNPNNWNATPEQVKQYYDSLTPKEPSKGPGLARRMGQFISEAIKTKPMPSFPAPPGASQSLPDTETKKVAHRLNRRLLWLLVISWRRGWLQFFGLVSRVSTNTRPNTAKK